MYANYTEMNPEYGHGLYSASPRQGRQAWQQDLNVTSDPRIPWQQHRNQQDILIHKSSKVQQTTSPCMSIEQVCCSVPQNIRR